MKHTRSCARSKKSESFPIDDGENLAGHSNSKISQSRVWSSSSSHQKLPSLYLYKEEDSEGELLSRVVSQFNDFFVPSLDEFRRTYFTTFTDFRMITNKDQESIIAATSGSVYALETSYLTVKHFGNSDRYSFISSTSIFDNESYGSFVPSDDGEAFIRTMKFYSDKTNSLMLPTLRNAKLTDTATCLIFWSFAIAPWISQTIVEAGQKIKKKLYIEQSKYYKNVLNCEDIALRMGRLMTIVASAQEAGVLLREEMQTYNLMGILKQDNILLKFFLS